MFSLTRYLVCQDGILYNRFLTNFPMSKRLEIRTTVQKWMTMPENVKKEATRAPKEAGTDFDRGPVTPELTRTKINCR
ncbi:hypothetical protein TNCV_1441201 [Trichonephila clavipes]|uniref:Uncharacterized protein n=1 Tax=Trichonephila clavipes TaxID=2585209 RepID=A0A8X6RLK8_TRICX|nr:hypothetical protein TNCV_1441201 [Trichonephila clavipes]